VTQSVELTLDVAADEVIAGQWSDLSAAGLPSSQRLEPSATHRPHVTLFAGDVLSPEADAGLPALVTALDLPLRVGAVLLFGPRRGQFVLARQVVVSAELLDLQATIAATCGASPHGQFGPGLWTPHVTLAPRVRSAQLGPALDVLGAMDEIEARVTQCRRWDSERRTAWWLTG